MAETEAGAADRHIYDALLKISNDLSFVKGQLEGLVDHKRAAEDRVEIRAETEDMIERMLSSALIQSAAVRKSEIGEATAAHKEYTDGRIVALETRLAAQEERDKKREHDIRLQFIGIGVIGMAGLAYALFNMAKEAGLG